ncbi:MAG: YcaO-like family protein [Desulfobacterales bacterium]
MRPPSPHPKTVEYEIRWISTDAGTGYFDCVPTGEPEWGRCARHLAACPWDSFMHRHLLRLALQLSPETMRSLIDATPENQLPVLSVLYEACLLQESFRPMAAIFPTLPSTTLLTAASPLIDLRSESLSDQGVHREWIRLFRDNLVFHRSLPAPTQVPFPTPYPTVDRPKRKTPLSPPMPEASSEEFHQANEAVFQEANRRLEAAGMLHGSEMRHLSSLAPVGLLREWRMAVTVRSGRHQYALSGIQTAYGKGLDPDRARASLAMEIVERASAFVDVDGERLPNLRGNRRLIRCRYAELDAQGRKAIDPNSLHLEVPYEDQPLWWIGGEAVTPGGPEPVWVPAQAVFLFSNLDEIDLFSGLGSTGLASGTRTTQARLNALYELIERDAEATTLYDSSDCFRPDSDHPFLFRLLAEYRRCGIHLGFQDLTGITGVPCYKCFTETADGRIIKGTGANLSGPAAALSALTEVPCAFPDAPPTRPIPDTVPVRKIESLPDFASGDPDRDFPALDQHLRRLGLEPVYVDLTRSDLDFPVFRVLVPGLESTGDFDRYARVNPRLFADYLHRFGTPAATLDPPP